MRLRGLFLILILTLGVALSALDFQTSGLEGRPPVTLDIDYSDSWFGASTSLDYDHRIARFACFLSDVSYVDVKKNPNDNVLFDAYRKIGITDDKVEFFYDLDYDDPLYGNNQCAFSIASKRVGGKTILFLVIRGTPLGANEWLSNLNIANSTKKKERLHEGFAKARDLVHAAFVSYLLRYKIDIDNCYMLITGHSRGAAIANLIGAVIEDQDDFLDSKKAYIYTFACPNDTTREDCSDKKYDFIHNIINPEDAVPYVPPDGKGWEYKKFGRVHTFISAWGEDKKVYQDAWGRVIEFSNALIGRDYAPFGSGGFYPLQVCSLVKMFNDTIEKYYQAGVGIHGMGETLMGKIFSRNYTDLNSKKKRENAPAPDIPLENVDGTLTNENLIKEDLTTSDETSEEEKKEKLAIKKQKQKSENGVMKIFANWINKSHKDGFEYLKKALNDMHACETYLSFMLALDEKEIFTKLGFCQFIINGQAEGIVLSKQGKLLLRFSNGNVDYSTLQDMSIAAFSFLKAQVIIGVPSNIEVDILITNESLINTPMTIKMERYNESGTLVSATESRDIYPRVNLMYRVSAGEATYITRDFRVLKLKDRESFHLTNRYKLRPEQYFHVAATTDFDTDLNVAFGCEVGCQAIYGVEKLGFNMERPKSCVFLTSGMGSRQTLMGPILFDCEILGKCFWALGDLDSGERQFNFVPEFKATISIRPVKFFSVYIACLFDFQFKDFNDGAFNKSVRRASLPLSPVGNENQLGTAVVCGIRLF